MFLDRNKVRQFKDIVAIVVGGTGSAGRILVDHLLKAEAKVVVLSRDEYKQSQIKTLYPTVNTYLVDIRDLSQLIEVFRHIIRYVGKPMYLYNCAALKRVPEGEFAPNEFLKTNVLGAINLITAWRSTCTYVSSKNLVLISSDKASAPVTIYGATKLLAERYWSRSGEGIVARYGNVINSRGSVLGYFQELAGKGERAPITHPQATRFIMTIEEAVDFIFTLNSMAERPGVYIPANLKATEILNLARIIWNNPQGSNWYKIIGLRGYEKLHETLVSSEELPFAYKAWENTVYLGIYANPRWEPWTMIISSATAEKYTEEELKVIATLEVAK